MAEKKHVHHYSVAKNAAPGVVRLRKGVLEYEHDDASCAGRPMMLILDEHGMNASRVMALVGLIQGLPYEVTRISAGD